jgi:hypothetical protein
MSASLEIVQGPLTHPPRELLHPGDDVAGPTAPIAIFLTLAAPIFLELGLRQRILGQL